MSYWLTTERLALRRFTPADIDWLAELYADDRVARFIGGTKDRDGVATLLRVRILEYYDLNPGLGMWMTVERATGHPVGFHLINHIQGETILQIGYGLATSAWGQGYATEMAKALMRYAFVDLALPHLVGTANLANVASHRVLLKIGLHRHGERALPHPAYASDGPLAWFERTREDWLGDPDRGPRRYTS